MLLGAVSPRRPIRISKASELAPLVRLSPIQAVGSPLPCNNSNRGHKGSEGSSRGRPRAAEEQRRTHQAPDARPFGNSISNSSSSVRISQTVLWRSEAGLGNRVAREDLPHDGG